MTSAQAVGKIRGIFNAAKAGHAGTLDPFASGLLIVGISRESTRRLDEFKILDKTYHVTAHFGATSDTQDIDGVVSPTPLNTPITHELLEKTIPQFIGQIKQTPPMFSAKKVKGKKLYELARQGKEIKRKPSTINIHSINILKIDPCHATLEVKCSTGTYIRTLVHYIGQALGCGAFAEKLTRTSIGEYSLEDAHEIAELDSKNWQTKTF